MRVTGRGISVVFLLLCLLIHSGPLGAQTDFEKYPGNPVLQANRAFDPNVLFDGETYQMWYRDDSPDHLARIYRATSGDGLDWETLPADPVLEPTPGSWDYLGVRNPCVLHGGASYEMWYEGQGEDHTRFGYATSPDGVVWTKYEGNPILDVGPPGSWDDTDIWGASVIFNGSTYEMWYSGFDGDKDYIGYATSPDGTEWTKHEQNPVLDVGLPGSWDDAEVADPHVLLTGSEYQMWFAGFDGLQWRTGYASFTYGGGWVKYEGNPVLREGNAGEWDDRYAAGPSVLRFGETYHLYYFGYSGTRFQIGLAVDSTAVGGIEDGTPDVQVPHVFSLEQNHPNPFNPTTTIAFTVPDDPPGTHRVTLSVYDIRGRKLVNLVDADYEPGIHRVVWNGRDSLGVQAASGIYLYTLTCGNRVSTRKMVILE